MAQVPNLAAYRPDFSFIANAGQTIAAGVLSAADEKKKRIAEEAARAFRAKDRAQAQDLYDSGIIAIAQKYGEVTGDENPGNAIAYASKFVQPLYGETDIAKWSDQYYKSIGNAEVALEKEGTKKQTADFSKKAIGGETITPARTRTDITPDEAAVAMANTPAGSVSAGAPAVSQGASQAQKPTAMPATTGVPSEPMRKSPVSLQPIEIDEAETISQPYQKSELRTAYAGMPEDAQKASKGVYESAMEQRGVEDTAGLMETISGTPTDQRRREELTLGAVSASGGEPLTKGQSEVLSTIPTSLDLANAELRERWGVADRAFRDAMALDARLSTIKKERSTDTQRAVSDAEKATKELADATVALDRFKARPAPGVFPDREAADSLALEQKLSTAAARQEAAITRAKTAMATEEKDVGAVVDVASGRVAKTELPKRHASSTPRMATRGELKSVAEEYARSQGKTLSHAKGDPTFKAQIDRRLKEYVEKENLITE